MARFDDTPALFGEGAGHGTTGNVSCDICGMKLTNREDEEGNATSLDNDSICIDDFGSLQVADCCFEKVEDAVLQNMHRILPWFLKILQSRKANLKNSEQLIAQIRTELRAH